MDLFKSRTLNILVVFSCTLLVFGLLITGCEEMVADEFDVQKQSTVDPVPIDPNPGDGDGDGGDAGGFCSTGCRIALDFPIDQADDNLNGPLLQGLEGSKTTLRVRFFPGKDVNNGNTTSLVDLSVVASQNFGGLTTDPFISESDVSGNEATFLITTPQGRHDKTRIITLSGTAKDSSGGSMTRTTTLLVNTTTILTTNPEYNVVTTVIGPDVNPLTTDEIFLHMRSTLNSDLFFTGVGELIDSPPGRFDPADLPIYVPVFGKMTLGGGKFPRLETLPANVDFPAGTVEDFPGSRVLIRNFCIVTDILPDLTAFQGNLECASGETITTELSGLPGLALPTEAVSAGSSTTSILPTAPERGLTLNTTQITSAIDINETTVDFINLELFEITTQPDLSIAGKLKLVFTPDVPLGEPEVIVDFSSQPLDLMTLKSVSNPITLRVPQGILPDLNFPVITQGIRILLNLTPDFRFSYGEVLPGGFASTALADFDIEGASFSKMGFPPVGPNDPSMDLIFDPLLILGTAGESGTLQAVFTPGTQVPDEPSTVGTAIIEFLGPNADKVVLGKTTLSATDFDSQHIAEVLVTVAPGVNITETTIVPFKITGTDSRASAFLGYGALTLKRTGPQPPIPSPPPFLFKQFSIRPDVILGTGDILQFQTVDMIAEYDEPGKIRMSGTAVLFDPPGIDFEIPISSVFNGKTLEIIAEPIDTMVPQGALEDVRGVAGVEIKNLGFQGFFFPDLITAGLTATPGATVVLPNGVIQEFQGAALLQLTENILQGPNDPMITVQFAPNPVIYSISPRNESILAVQFIPGVGTAGTQLSEITCIADQNFDTLRTTNFSSLDDFDATYSARYAVIPPASYVPEVGAFITVTCEAIDGLGRRATSGDFLVYSNSPFQAPYPLPDIILGNFNTDPETASVTPPEGVFPFDGDGLCFRVQNQLLFPGISRPTVTGSAQLTHFTKTDSFNPPRAHWEPFVDRLHGGQTFSLPFSGTLNLTNLTMRTDPIGTGGDCIDNSIGLLPDGRICFPAGEAQEDVFFNGQPQTLIAPLQNFALLGNFTSDLRTLTSTSALSCSARLACNGTNFCSPQEGNFGEPCNAGDENPNPFGVATYIYGIPPFPDFLALPLNSFGFGQQVPAECPINTP